MDFSCIYNDNLTALCNAKNQIETKIYEKEIEMLKSPDIEPRLIVWITNNLDGVLAYIPHARNMGNRGDVIGLDEEDNHPIYWNHDYIRNIFPEEDRFNYIEEAQDDMNSWDVCQLSIDLIPEHYIHLTYDDEIQNSYNYSVEYCVNSKYVFMADILENILLKNREEIWNIYYQESRGE
jgi:hypothetical protein